MDAPLLAADVKFMFYGMGMALLLLAVIKIRSAIKRKYFSKPIQEECNTTIVGEITGEDASVDKKIVAAITAAVTHHRQGK